MKQPLLFNSLPVDVSPADGVEPDQATIETVPNLRGASIADAIRFGGPAVARILERMPIHCDRRYVIVDTKVAYLMKGGLRRSRLAHRWCSSGRERRRARQGRTEPAGHDRRLHDGAAVPLVRERDTLPHGVPRGHVHAAGRHGRGG
ncbi:hypothetical protein GS415_04880 [Rhodococcus hoagii]|nr:hypothetical protein [Prescottella equi]